MQVNIKLRIKFSILRVGKMAKMMRSSPTRFYFYFSLKLNPLFVHGNNKEENFKNQHSTTKISSHQHDDPNFTTLLL